MNEMPAPNAHDYLLHRTPNEWPMEREHLTAAALPDGSVIRGEQAASKALLRYDPSSQPCSALFLVHGYAHGEQEYRLHASVLRLSQSMWLLRRSQTLVYVNNKDDVSTEALIDHISQYQPGTLRMLIHTARDVGHLCAEFQLLAATAHITCRYRWVVYISGPDTYLTPVATARIEFFVRNSTKALHADLFPAPPRHHRYALDTFLFRPAAGFMLPAKVEREVPSDDRSVWMNATAMCMAHRAFNGLPETVLHWVQETFGLGRASLGKRAPWAGCQRVPVYHCDIGLGGVWHTHNASAVREWLARRTELLARGVEMLRRIDWIEHERRAHQRAERKRAA